MKPSLEEFITDIMHSAEFVTAVHDNFKGESLGRVHWHPNIYQISYYLRGQDHLIIGKHHYSAKEGDLLFIPPRRMHGSQSGAKQSNFEMLQVKFRINKSFSSFSPSLPVYLHVGYPSDLLFVFHFLINEYHMQLTQRDTVMRLNLALMVMLIQRLSQLKGTNRYAMSLKDFRFVEKRIEKIKRYIETNSVHELTLADIASRHGYGVSTLGHVFKQHVGISPIKYLINHRLSKALELLGHTDRKLEDVALACGFKNEYYFSRLFKKRYNQSPRRYAKMIYNTA